MRDAESLRHMAGHRRSAESFARVVATGDEGNAGFAGVMRLRLRDFARDKGIGASGDRALEIALRAAGAPRHALERAAVARHARDAAPELLRHELSQFVVRQRQRGIADESQVLLAEARTRHE